MKIIIDGYNLLYQCSYGLAPHLEETRNRLISDLAKYKRIKRANITVVFDAQMTSNLSTTSYKEKGIGIVFTRQGRTADEEICSMIEGKAIGITVVSSDREVMERVEAMGAVCIDSTIFVKKLNEAVMYEMKGVSEYNNMYREKPKKGPSRRPSKKERRRKKVISDL